MKEQVTPIHNELWHKGFCSLLAANLLLTTAVYMMIPVAASWLRGCGMPLLDGACILGAYGAGLFVLGPLCSYFIQRFRRNHVCELSILLLGLCLWAFGMLQQDASTLSVAPWVLVAVRLLMGTFFGLAQMVLSSTLVIDVCESFQRTHANHASAWFSRIAMCCGPLAALLLSAVLPPARLYWVMSLLCIAAAMLIQMVTIPFRAPSDDYPSFSLDRFFLPLSWPLFLLQVGASVVVGYYLVQPHPWMTYALLLAGLFLSLPVVRLVSDDTVRKVIAISALLLMSFALSFVGHGVVQSSVANVMLGFGVGLLDGCMLTFFLNLSNHCQRGTSQSSCFLSWELGIALGLALGFAFPPADFFSVRVLLLACVIAFLFFVHPWYLRHKVR